MNCLFFLCLMCMCGNQGGSGCGYGNAANTSVGSCADTLENVIDSCSSCGEVEDAYVQRSRCDEPRPEYRGNRGPRPIYPSPSAQDGGCGCN